jgi:hypothetical protein
MLECNLPPVRFARLGWPGFYVTWARPALFTAGLVTNMDGNAPRRRLADVGGQVDLRFTMLSRLGMTFSVGWARAFERHRSAQSETMVSLKIL